MKYSLIIANSYPYFFRYVFQKWGILFLLALTFGCNSGRGQNIVSHSSPLFDVKNVEIMFWQNEQDLWVGNRFGVARLNQENRTIEQFPGINCLSVLIIQEPEQLWCGENWFDGISWQTANIEIDTPIRAKDGTIWAGSEEGLARFDPTDQKWVYVLRVTGDGLQSPQIFNRGRPGIHLTAEAQDGALWFYSYDDNAGINRWTGDSHQNWFLGSDDFMMIPRLVTRDGDVWATSEPPYHNDIVHWDGQSWQFLTPFSETASSPELMIEATDGTVWAATGSGEVGRWDVKGWQIWAVFSGNPFLWNIFQTRDENVWVISELGKVGRWDGQQWQTWDEQQVAPETDGTSIKPCVPEKSDAIGLTPEELAQQSAATYIKPSKNLEDATDNVWILPLQPGGVSRWTGKCWRHYTTSDGLF